MPSLRSAGEESPRSADVKHAVVSGPPRRCASSPTQCRPPWTRPGRFTQEDPIGLAGGMNLYGYAGGDPVNYADPFGLCTTPQVGLQILRCALGLASVAPVAPSNTGAKDLSVGGTVRVGAIATTVSVGTNSGFTFSQRLCLNCTSPASVSGGVEARFADSQTGGVSVEAGPFAAGDGAIGLNAGTPDACLLACVFATLPTPASADHVPVSAPAVVPDATTVRSGPPPPRVGPRQ
jgi:hypothetical protein